MTETKTELTAYCVKDKESVVVQNPKVIIMKNNRPATTGTCPKCGNKLYRIGM